MNITLHTDGSGLWSKQAKPVEIINAILCVYDNDGSTWGHLRVYFNINDWDVSKDGLIYTDKLWLSQLKSYLIGLDFSKQSLEKLVYSEQGMQGSDYVDLDVDYLFIKQASKLKCFDIEFAD